MTEPGTTPPAGAGDQDVRWDRFASVWADGQASVVSPVRARATAIAIGLWSLAAMGLFVGWNGAAGRPSVALQLPYLITTGMFVVAAGVGGAIAHVAGVIAGGRRAALDRGHPDHDTGDHDAVPPEGSGSADRGSRSQRSGKRRQLAAGTAAVAMMLGIAGPFAPAGAVGEAPEDRLATFVGALDEYADELDEGAERLRYLHAAGPLGRAALTLHVVRSQVEGAPTLARLLDASRPVLVDIEEGRVSAELVGNTLRDPLVAIASSTGRSGRLATELLNRSAGSPGRAGVRQEDEIDPEDLLVPVFQLSVEVLQPILDIIEASEPVLMPLEDVFGAACVDGLGLVQLGVNAAPALIELPTLPVDVAQLVNGALTPTFLVCSALPTPQNVPEEGQATSPPPLAEPTPTPPARPDPSPKPVPSTPVVDSPLPSPASSAPTPAPIADGSDAVAVGPAIPLAPIETVGIAFDRSLEQAGLFAVLALCAAVAATIRRWKPHYGWEVPAGAAGITASIGAAILAWNGVASSATSWIQLPYVLSGVGAALLLGMAGATLAATPMIESLAQARTQDV